MQWFISESYLFNVWTHFSHLDSIPFSFISTPHSHLKLSGCLIWWHYSGWKLMPWLRQITWPWQGDVSIFFDIMENLFAKGPGESTTTEITTEERPSKKFKVAFPQKEGESSSARPKSTLPNDLAYVHNVVCPMYDYNPHAICIPKQHFLFHIRGSREEVHVLLWKVLLLCFELCISVQSHLA